jgi:hypothetical protein
MASEEGEIKASLPPRTFKFIFIAWAIFAFYSAFKGMKQFRWPQPLSYRGMTVVLFTGIAVYIAWRLSQNDRIRRAWLILIDSDTTPQPNIKETTSQRAGVALWFALGLSLLIGAFAWLEYRDPYFFTQDDNLSQFLPVIMQGCESMLTDGRPATYNPNQFAGAPTASIGTYALTYPGTYLSYWIARDALGDPAATIDVFCVLHLVYGYPILFALLRRVGCAPGIATAGALSFLLQGFFLINGRSWFYMAPTALWMPTLLLLAERLRQGLASRFWSLGAGLAIGAFFHSGNVQMWVYGMSIFVLVLAIWIITGQLSWRALFPIAGALLVGFGIALPLFVPQFAETASSKRIIDGASIDWTLGSLYLPWPLTPAGTAGPALFGAENREYIGQFMYSGTTFVLAATLVIVSMIAHRWKKRTWGQNAYAPLAFIAFAAALGQMGLIWFVFSKLPIFSKFAHPFKYVPIMTLLAVLAGGIALERLTRSFRRRDLIATAIAALTIALLAYHVALPLPSAFTYGFKPFPAPSDSLKSDAQPPQRIISLTPYRHGAAEFGRMPANNLPTVQGLYSLIGYDPIVMRRQPALTMFERLGHVESYTAWGNWMPSQWRERQLTDDEKASRVAALRAYGVDTVFTFGATLRPPYEKAKLTYIFYRGDRYLWDLLDAVRSLPESERPIVSNSKWGVTYRLAGADPLAFLERTRPAPQKISFSTQGAAIDLAGVQEGDYLIVNLIDEPGSSFLNAYVDGTLVRHAVDQWKRIRLPLPANGKRVEIRYEPPFLKWLLIGVPFVLVGAVIGLRRVPRKSG